MNKLWAVAAILFLCFLGCNCNKSKKKPNLSGIDVRLEVQRFEKDFFTLHPNNPEMAVNTLQEKYPDFLPFYFDNIMQFGNVENEPVAAIVAFSVYRNDKYVKEVADTVLKVFDDFSIFEKQLTEAFRYFSYYFPQKNIPRIITFTGNFGWSAISLDTFILGIGTDMYLGENYRFYPSVYPKYIYEKFKPEYMTANTMNVASTMFFDIEPKDNTLLAGMIAEGMKLYFLDLVMPDADDYLKIGFNPKDIEWCKKNEAEIWTFFVKKDILYKSDPKDYKKFLQTAPNTSGMPLESPGRVGIWTGWQIVRRYIEQHPETSFEQLIEMNPVQLLNESKYKPKR
jgi:hypothetical protein